LRNMKTLPKNRERRRRGKKEPTFCREKMRGQTAVDATPPISQKGRKAHPVSSEEKKENSRGSERHCLDREDETRRGNRLLYVVERGEALLLSQFTVITKSRFVIGRKS